MVRKKSKKLLLKNKDIAKRLHRYTFMVYGGETPLFSLIIILTKVLTFTPVQFGLALI